ncbi:MAG TPA: hypothetical protein VHC90_03935 [Bryobacteraceae bacterium]|nr:hypothetical protein [Bryobacteraceae bacterium]
MQKLIAGLLGALVVIFGALTWHLIRTDAPPAFQTPYQAVLLNGGQVYYGKLENASGMYPVLRDVFYVVRKEDPQNHQVANILVRRGKELHGPEYMVLSRQSILFIEPVKEDSEIGRSIAARKNKPE